MSYQLASSLMEARFESNWDGTLPVRWPNSRFKAPPDGAAFVTFDVQQAPENTQKTSIGPTGRHRSTGLLVISLQMPADKGVGEGRGYADTIAAYFRGQSDTSGAVRVLYRAPSVSEVGPNSASRYQIDVLVPVVWDYTTS